MKEKVTCDAICQSIEKWLLEGELEVEILSEDFCFNHHFGKVIAEMSLLKNLKTLQRTKLPAYQKS